MTLREHLENIGEVMTSQGASKVEVLFFRLYLLCLAWDSFLGDDEGVRDSKDCEPYNILLKKTSLGSLWAKACEQHGHDELDALDSFLNDEDLFINTPKEVFRDVFNALLNGAARTNNHGFDHLQPAELSELVYKLSGYQEGMTVYNPFAGVGSYAGQFSAGNQYYGEEFDPTIWGIGVLRCHINECLSENYICGDSLNRCWQQPFDVVVSTPPVGAISLKEDTYPGRLVKESSSLLKDDGTMLLVTSGSFLFSQIGHSVAECTALDLVITLPRNVFYWTSYPPVIVRLKKGRDTSKPIKLVDGADFSIPGGKTTMVNVKSLLQAMEAGDSRYVAEVSAEDIAKNHHRLNPALYIQNKDDEIDGKKMVPLRDLCSIIRPKRAKEQPKIIIRPRNLSDNPLKLDVSPEERGEDDHGNYGIVSGSALLIGGDPAHPRFGWLNTSEEEPIGVSALVFALIPNSELVSAQYVAVVLTEKGVDSSGSSIVRITLDDLSLTRIPLIPKNEQQLVVREYAQKHAAFQQPLLPRQKVRVAIIGEPAIPESAKAGLDERSRFSNAMEARTWIQNSENSRKIDAFVVKQTGKISSPSIMLLCGSEAGIPVFILSKDLQELESVFADYADLYLPGKSFPIDGEPDLFVALFKYMDEQYSPEGQIREVYARQLEAAANLDGKFCYNEFCLRDKLEEILLNKDACKDYRNDLRKIRDNCLLDPLINYGYLPQTRKKIFLYGAEVDFLADRYYKNDLICYFLLKTVVPKNLASLLRATSFFLNEGSHALPPADRDIQLIVLQVIMSFICHMSELVNQGFFDKMEPEKVNKECLGSMSDFMFQSGWYQVQCLKDDPDYLFAENVHLDTQACKVNNIKAGDFVSIQTVITEKQPRITDYEKVVFFSKIFQKVR